MIGKKNGFTLTEVLMVVVIIGVLSSLIIPRFTAQPERANAAEAAGILGAIRQGELAYRLDTGVYLAPGNWALLGLDNPNSAKWTYTVDSGSGAATAERQGGTYDGDTITLSITGQWSGSHPFVPTNT
ncbi:MAG: prepilin-type N-terminal cleavage/methylation domain-containing protein [Candidatus Omnitrophica bacterium]|nr:prepilin-type N-terminal cleavage/methylation domain-containing protein [Candidatus Omnitrophota bacterium]